MFRGSENNDGDYSWPISPRFSTARAWTERDRTVYQTTVTRNALELVLWLEADRMGFLVPALKERNLASEREVVKMERRQTVDDVVLGEVSESLLRALYPPGHPYRHMEIGSFADVSAAQLSDVAAFCRSHYAPDNAFLCVAGDFTPALVKRWIRQYFGALYVGLPDPPPEVVRQTPVSPCHLTLTDRVSHPYVTLVWKTVPAYHPDEAVLYVLASVLAGPSRSARLNRMLVEDHRLAIAVAASHPTYLLAGSLDMTLVANSRDKLDECSPPAEEEIERLKERRPHG